MKNSKKLVLAGCICLVLSVSFILSAQKEDWIQEEENITSTISLDLNKAVQHIPKIIFAVSNSDGTRKEADTTAVEIKATVDTLQIEGSLVTNVEQKNIQHATAESKNFSLLWGSGNTLSGDVGESTIIGGEGNTITTKMSLIAGGEGNKITSGDRSTILWGKNNTINGLVSTIIGGEGSTISGNYSVTIGSNHTVSGNNALAAGKKANVTTNSSFAWNDGSSTFDVTQNNLFAIKGTKGMVVGKDTPNAVAALSVGGALRIQENTTKNAQLGTGITCAPGLAGTVKSVKAVYNNNTGTPSNQLCPCLCNGTKWEPMLTTPQCINACEGRVYTGGVAEEPRCWATFGTCKDGLGNAKPTWLVKDKNGSGVYSYVYGTITGGVPNNTSTNTAYQIATFGKVLATANSNLYQGGSPYQKDVLNTRFWSCRNEDTQVSVTCRVAFSCQGTTPVNANICNYSAADNIKKDDRELKQNVDKKLIGTPANRCSSTSDANPPIRSILDGQINNCKNDNNPNNQKIEKCEFYCPDGWHKESDGNCHKNSCKKENENYTEAGYTVTFQPGCIDTAGDVQNGYNGSQGVSASTSTTYWTLTFSTTYSCNLGVRTKTNPTHDVVCVNFGYKKSAWNYKCEPKTCSDAGLLTSPRSCYNDSVSYPYSQYGNNVQCYAQGSPKTCSQEGGYTCSHPGNNYTCSTYSTSCGNTAYSCSLKGCSDLGYSASQPSGQTCSTTTAPNGDTCYYNCNNNSCWGTAPSGAGIKTSTGTPTTTGTNWEYVAPSSFSSSSACKRTCNSGYDKDGNGCTSTSTSTYSCWGTTPSGVGVKISTGTPTATGTNWAYVASGSFSSSSTCKWTCEAGYVQDGTGCKSTSSWCNTVASKWFPYCFNIVF